MNPRDWTAKQQLERGIGAGVLVLVLVWPALFGTYWSHQILIETFLFGIAAALTVNPLVQEKVPYDPVRHFMPISAVSNFIFVVAVDNGVPAHSLVDLAHIAKAEPGKLLWGSGPSLPRFIFSAFLKRKGLDMSFVPYRDAATPPVDLGEGRVHVLVTGIVASNAPVQSGQVLEPPYRFPRSGSTRIIH